jgi:hypothetical protein
MEYPSRYDTDRIFLRGVVARDIAEPLPSFDRNTPADVVRAAMAERNYIVAGVRDGGMVSGYIVGEEVGQGACGDQARVFEEAIVVSDSTPLIELIRALHGSTWVFVTVLGQVGGIVTRADLQDPPVRMWLFGLVTTFEMHFQRLIELHFSDEGWMQYLSPARVGKAQEMAEERKRRNYSPTLLDCLQFSDKGQIIARCEELREKAGFASRRRADEVVKRLEALRNNLAHSQDIVDSDWETIVAIAENLERAIALGYLG